MKRSWLNRTETVVIFVVTAIFFEWANVVVGWVGGCSKPEGEVGWWAWQMSVSGRRKNKLFGGLKKNAYFCITYY